MLRDCIAAEEQGRTTVCKNSDFAWAPKSPIGRHVKFASYFSDFGQRSARGSVPRRDPSLHAHPSILPHGHRPRRVRLPRGGVEWHRGARHLLCRYGADAERSDSRRPHQKDLLPDRASLGPQSEAARGSGLRAPEAVSGKLAGSGADKGRKVSGAVADGLVAAGDDLPVSRLFSLRREVAA